MHLAIEMLTDNITISNKIHDQPKLNYSNNNFNDKGLPVMRLTVRQRKIFEVLWSVRDYVTVKFISQHVAFSEKTIRGDLDSIKNAIDAQQIGKLVAKTNKGFYLDIERAAYEKISANHINLEPLRRIKNRMHSLLILLFNCDSFSLQDLADSIYLDRRSLKKYYDEAEEWLAKRNISITKADALYQLSYHEFDLRRGLWDLFIEIKNAYKAEGDSDSAFILLASKKHHIDTADIYGLNVLFKKEMAYLPQLQMAINDVELHSNYKYTYDAYIWILFSSLVLFQRHHHPIALDQYLSSTLLSELDGVHQSAMAIWLLKGLNGITRFTLSHSEVPYLTACLLGAEYSFTTGTDIGDESTHEQAMVCCIKAFIVSLSHVVGAEIAKDKRLLQRLFYLINPMIYRHRFGLKSDLSHASRALVRQVKSSYLDLFLEVELCCEIFNQRYGVTLSEIDMSLITLCIRNTQSSAVKKIRISIVCNHGMGISYFISQKIQRAISQVEIVDVLSLREIDRLTHNNSDLVICTTPLDTTEYQVIQVNDTLMPYDLSLIKETVKKMQKMKTLQSVVNMKEIKGFQKFIHQQMVFISDYQDTYQTLESITQRAEQLNLCQPQYLLSVLEREKAAPTQIGPGVVLTHGYPDWVQNNFISICLLTKPILWADEFYVDIIIMVGLKKSANGKFASCIAEFYSMLAALLEDDDLMKALRSCNTDDALFDFFVNVNNLRNIHETDRSNHSG